MVLPPANVDLTLKRMRVLNWCAGILLKEPLTKLCFCSVSLWALALYFLIALRTQELLTRTNPTMKWVMCFASFHPCPGSCAQQRHPDAVSFDVWTAVFTFRYGAASWLGGQSSWLLTMRSRVRFLALPCAFPLERGRRPWWPWSGYLVEIRFKAPPGTSDSPLITPSFSSVQRNRAHWASQPQKSVTLQPQPGRGGPRSLRGHVVALGGEKTFPYAAT